MTNEELQEIEDYEHFSHYEKMRINNDRERISNEFDRTLGFISLNSDCKAAEDTTERQNKYNKYKQICSKIDLPPLNYSEFLIKEANPFQCMYAAIFIKSPAGCYTLYNESTARYLNDYYGNLEKEFKVIWY